jgi:hypothetical protein
MQLDSFDPHTQNIYLYTRLEEQGSHTGYALQCGVQAGNDGYFRLLKSRAGSSIVLGSLLTQLLAPGDAIGVTAMGYATVQSWYCPNGGSWTLMDTVVDDDTTLARVRGPGKYGAFRLGPTATTLCIDTVGGGDTGHYDNKHAVRRVWAGRS